MNLNIESKQGNLAIALHAVKATESLDVLNGLNTQYMYDQLQNGFNGACVPKLIYLVDRQASVLGWKTFQQLEAEDRGSEIEKGYADLSDFYGLAELLYLVTLAYNASQNLHQVKTHSNPQEMNAYINACAEQAVRDLLAATRVLNIDSEDYYKMICILSNDTPLPYLRPMFHMIYSMLDSDTLKVIKTVFGSTHIESFVSALNEANVNLMRLCTHYSRHETEFSY